MVQVEEIDSEDKISYATARTPDFLLEGLVRSTLENMIAAGFCAFPVSYFAEMDRLIDGKLEITKEVLSLKFQDNEHFPGFSGTFSIGNPEVSLHISDCKRLVFVFHDKRKAVIQCLSRTSRDLIVMALHIFAAHTCLLHSKALEQFSTSFDRIEMSLELNEVLAQLHYLGNENSALKSENKRVKKELSDMEKDLANTIESYKHTIDSGHEGNYLEEIDKISKDLAKQINKKNKLRKRLRRKDKEIEQLKKKNEEFEEAQQNLLLNLKQNQNNEVRAKVEDIQGKLTEAHLELQHKNQVCMDNLSKISELAELQSSLEDKVKGIAEENARLKKEIFDHSSLLAEFSQMKNQNEALLGQRNILSKRIDSLQKDLAEQSLNSEQSEEGWNLRVKGLEDENKVLKEMLEKVREEQKVESVESCKEEVLKYRQQCDNLAAQLSRMQAQVRRNK